MALTPEDVVNKRFQSTRLREGYDQDEVDDFLDDVVVELRRLNQENEELRQRLIQSDSRPADASNPMHQMAPPQMAPPQMAPPQAASSGYEAPVMTDSSSMDPGNTNNLLQLARTLHEQHVREGMEKRDALIAEGQEAAARVVREAEEQQRTAIGGLEQQRIALESRVEELRNFERDYRSKLKGYIEGQLRELDADSLSSMPSANQYQDQPAPAYAGSPTMTNPPQSMPAPSMPPQSMPAPSMPPQSMPAPSMPPQAMPPQEPQAYPGFGTN